MHGIDRFQRHKGGKKQRETIKDIESKQQTRTKLEKRYARLYLFANRQTDDVLNHVRVLSTLVFFGFFFRFRCFCVCGHICC